MRCILSVTRVRQTFSTFIVFSCTMVILYTICRNLTYKCQNEDLNLLRSEILSLEKVDLEIINRVPLNITIRNSPSETCDVINGHKISILIAIKSYVGNYDQRLAIRNTWGDIQDPDIKRVFFVGEAETDMTLLEAEIRAYSDVVLGAFKDLYDNNIFKTLTIFKWIGQFCPNAKYVLLVDDDYFVNMKNIRIFVEDLKFMPHPWWMYGNRCFLCFANRFRSSKWYVSYSEYKFVFYPAYFRGGTILTTSHVVKKMTMISPYVPHFRIDDVYIGMLAEALGLDLYHEHRFNHKPPPLNQLDTILTSHGFGERGAMLKAWKCYKTSFLKYVYMYDMKANNLKR